MPTVTSHEIRDSGTPAILTTMPAARSRPSGPRRVLLRALDRRARGGPARRRGRRSRRERPEDRERARELGGAGAASCSGRGPRAAAEGVTRPSRSRPRWRAARSSPSATPRWTLAAVARRAALSSLMLYDLRACSRAGGRPPIRTSVSARRPTARLPDPPVPELDATRREGERKGRSGGPPASPRAWPRPCAAAARPRAARARSTTRPATRACSSRTARGYDDGCCERLPSEHGPRWWTRHERVSLVEPELAERVLERALARGGDLAELYAEDRHGFSLSLDDGRVERPQAGRERGASRARGAGRRRPTSATSTASPRTTCCAWPTPWPRRVRGEAREPRGAGAPPARPPGTRSRCRPRTCEAARKAELLRACDERARAAGAEVAQVRSATPRAAGAVEVFNSDGVAAADDRTRVRLGAQVVARRDDRVETGTTPAAATPASSCSTTTRRRWPSAAARKALTLLDAVDAPTGRLPVVVGQRLRRRAAARGGRPRPRGRRRAEARQRLRRAGWATSSPSRS